MCAVPAIDGPAVSRVLVRAERLWLAFRGASATRQSRACAARRPLEADNLDRAFDRWPSPSGETAVPLFASLRRNPPVHPWDPLVSVCGAESYRAERASQARVFAPP